MVVDDKANPVPGSSDAGKLLIVAGQHLLVPMLDHLDEEVSLVGEEAVDAAFDNASPLRDVRHQGFVVALFRKYDPRGEHDVGDPSFRGQTIYRSPRAGLTHRVSPH